MLQVAFFTGRSNPSSCALSPVQAEFLIGLQGPGRVLRQLNFPYDANTGPHEGVSLIAASLRNGAQYLTSRRLSYSSQHQTAVIALLSQAPHTVLLAGSCGLELLVNLRLPMQWRKRVSVFAYGPVARSVPDLRLAMVQGRKDWISRCFFSRVDHVVDCGHMDYLSNDDVAVVCAAFVDRVAALEAKGVELPSALSEAISCA